MRKISTLWQKITKQNETKAWIGGLKEVLGHTVFWVSMINFVLIAVTAYNTTLYIYINLYFQWMTFPIFMLFLVVLVAIAMLIEYKIIIPSVMAFRNKQEYEHQNLLRKDLDEIKERLKGIEDSINK
jgi:uncharacterized membrane protein